MSSISAGTTSTTTLVHSGDTTGSLVFKTNDTGSGGTTAVTIDTSQRVGIGVTSPAKPLSVYGADGYIQMLNASTGTANGDGAFIGVEGGTTALRIVNQENDAMSFHTNGLANERMRIDSSGNLLVGATSAFGSGPFQVKGGNLCMTINSGTFNYSFGTASNNFNVYDGGGTLKGYLTNAGTWTNTSDIAFKKDIIDIKYNLQDILKLRPVSYLTKDYEIPQIGFIAQETEKVIPEVVSGEDGSKGISYGSLVALCVKAIQEQQATITALTARIEALENK